MSISAYMDKRLILYALYHLHCRRYHNGQPPQYHYRTINHIMVGLSKPTELTSLEIEDGLYEDGEERQSLVGAGTPSSSHRGGGGRGSRGLGALDALAASGGGGDSYRASLVKRFACLLAVIVLVFAYQAGRDEGYASSKMHDDVSCVSC